MVAALAVAGVASVEIPEAAAQQQKFKGKKGGGGPGQQGPRRGGGKNRAGKIAGGIAAGIAAGIILNEIAKGQAEAREERHYRGDGLSCRQLLFRCEDGQEWACRKFDRRC